MCCFSSMYYEYIYLGYFSSCYNKVPDKKQFKEGRIYSVKKELQSIMIEMDRRQEWESRLITLRLPFRSWGTRE